MNRLSGVTWAEALVATFDKVFDDRGRSRSEEKSKEVLGVEGVDRNPFVVWLSFEMIG